MRIFQWLLSQRVHTMGAPTHQVSNASPQRGEARWGESQEVKDTGEEHCPRCVPLPPSLSGGGEYPSGRYPDHYQEHDQWQHSDSKRRRYFVQRQCHDHQQHLK
jgi:hypothetical protein